MPQTLHFSVDDCYSPKCSFLLYFIIFYLGSLLAWNLCFATTCREGASEREEIPATATWKICHNLIKCLEKQRFARALLERLALSCFILESAETPYCELSISIRYTNDIMTRQKQMLDSLVATTIRSTNNQTPSLKHSLREPAVSQVETWTMPSWFKTTRLQSLWNRRQTTSRCLAF